MATVPLSGTNIRLLSGVPFSNDYKHTRWFTSVSEQTNWFTSRNVVHSINQANFQKIEGKNFVAVNQSIDELWGTNYLMFRNASYNNKWFYAFVTHMEYKQRNNTHVYFQIDVLNTWRFDMSFKPSFVLREHRPLWNSDGSPVINTLDEGLNYGTEYDNVSTTRISHVYGDYKFMVIVSKTNMTGGGGSNEIEGGFIGNPQPLHYYLLPFNNSLSGTVFAEGQESYPISDPVRTLTALYGSENAVNNIVSIYVTEYVGISFNYSSGEPNVFRLSSNSNAEVEPAVIEQGVYVLSIKDCPTFDYESVRIATDKYSDFYQDDTITESKLLMYPYTVTIFDDFKGNRAEFKNEYIKGNPLDVTIKGTLGINNNVTYGIPRYNSEHVRNEVQRSNESALISNAPNTIPILNDMLAAFLQGNRNSIQTQKNSVMWNGVMGAIGNSIGGVASAKNANPIGVASSSVNVAQGLGNTVLDLQAIESKQQDISNVPPQMGNMGSDTNYDYGNDYNGMYVIRKQIKPEYKRILEDFFNMFGYKTHEVKVPNFRTRQNWNYVQTKECNITGNFNNEDLQELKDVFNNGITLWHTNDIGNYSLSNGVR